MMESSFIKDYIFYPILGLIGWHYNSINNRVESAGEDIGKLKVNSAKHSLRLDEVEEAVDRFESKMDGLLETIESKVDSIIIKLDNANR